MTESAERLNTRGTTAALRVAETQAGGPALPGQRRTLPPEAARNTQRREARGRPAAAAASAPLAAGAPKELLAPVLPPPPASPSHRRTAGQILSAFARVDGDEAKFRAFLHRRARVGLPPQRVLAAACAALLPPPQAAGAAAAAACGAAIAASAALAARARAARGPAFISLGGAAGSGRSAVCYAAAARILCSGGRALWVDADGGFSAGTLAAAVAAAAQPLAVAAAAAQPPPAAAAAVLPRESRRRPLPCVQIFNKNCECCRRGPGGLSPPRGAAGSKGGGGEGGDSVPNATAHPSRRCDPADCPLSGRGDAGADDLGEPLARLTLVRVANLFHPARPWEAPRAGVEAAFDRLEGVVRAAGGAAGDAGGSAGDHFAPVSCIVIDSVSALKRAATAAAFVDGVTAAGGGGAGNAIGGGAGSGGTVRSAAGGRAAGGATDGPAAGGAAYVPAAGFAGSRGPFRATDGAQFAFRAAAAVGGVSSEKADRAPPAPGSAGEEAAAAPLAEAELRAISTAASAFAQRRVQRLLAVAAANCDLLIGVEGGVPVAEPAHSPSAAQPAAAQPATAQPVTARAAIPAPPPQPATARAAVPAPPPQPATARAADLAASPPISPPALPPASPPTAAPPPFATVRHFERSCSFPAAGPGRRRLLFTPASLATPAWLLRRTLPAAAGGGGGGAAADPSAASHTSGAFYLWRGGSVAGPPRLVGPFTQPGDVLPYLTEEVLPATHARLTRGMRA